MNWRPAYTVLLLATLFASLVVPALMAGNLGTLRSLPLQYVVPILIALLISWFAKAAKYALLVSRLKQPVSLRTSLLTSLGCDFAFAATPAGIGGYPATIFLLAKAGVPAATGAAVAAADQILDLVFFAAAIPLGLAYVVMTSVSLPELVGRQFVAAALTLVTASILVASATMTSSGRGVLTRMLPPSWLQLWRQKLLAAWQRTRAQLGELSRSPPRTITWLLLATVIQWTARYSILAIALPAAGVHVPFAMIVLVQATALHAGQWTGVPGGIGSADLIAAQMLRPWASLEMIAGSLLVWRIATFHATLAIGGAAFLIQSRMPRE